MFRLPVDPAGHCILPEEPVRLSGYSILETDYVLSHYF